MGRRPSCAAADYGQIVPRFARSAGQPVNRSLQSDKPTGGEAHAARGAMHLHLNVRKAAASGEIAELTGGRDLHPSGNFATLNPRVFA
jgi:hypothetical protein